jgi:hypothetical protein
MREINWQAIIGMAIFIIIIIVMSYEQGCL